MRSVIIQEAVDQLAAMGTAGEANPGDLAYMQIVALFAIVERLDKIEAAILKTEPA